MRRANFGSGSHRPAVLPITSIGFKEIAMKFVRTSEGHLLIWERGTTRYTLGYRFSRRLKRWYASRWQIVARPFAMHFVRFPMTEAEKRRRADDR